MSYDNRDKEFVERIRQSKRAIEATLQFQQNTLPQHVIVQIALNSCGVFKYCTKKEKEVVNNFGIKMKFDVTKYVFENPETFNTLSIEFLVKNR